MRLSSSVPNVVPDRERPVSRNQGKRQHPVEASDTKLKIDEKRGRGRATKQDGRLERELRAEAVPEGRRGREDSRTTHRVRCPSTPTTAATRNHVRGPRRSGTQGRKLATRPRPIRPGERGGVASSEDRGRRARSGKEQAEQAAGTAGAVTTRIHLPTTPTNTRGPPPPPQGDGKTQQRGAAPSTAGRETQREVGSNLFKIRTASPEAEARLLPSFPSQRDNKNPPAEIINFLPPLQTPNTEEGRGARREARGGEGTRGVSDWGGTGDEESQREPREQRYRRREWTDTSVSHRTSISLSESTEGISGPTWSDSVDN
ncbi:hypothetical protein NDU88_002785 [Pleurodeles waltl]|uniref:Uncharacterized protein n=1 Tax=Pleurodeles waltl TaxID=8319 RepID=A0AAV7W0B1_PLEWA|nr:hypothetical protein NDU88_002785 [Pleurodeles waltl]